MSHHPHPYLAHPGPIPFAHRGGSLENPENTMAAFAHAIDLGYGYLETDVRITADGHLLVFHDEHLDRVSDRRGVVHELTLEEVREARLHGGLSDPTDEVAPLLEDLLRTWPHIRVNIDAKDDRVVDELIAVVRRTDAVERVCVASFSSTRLQRVRDRLGPELCTALSPAEILRLRLRSVRVPLRSRPRGLCAEVPVYYTSNRGKIRVVDRRFVQAAHELEIPVHVWTVDDEDEMHRLLDLGVDGLITDRPTVLKSLLQARGAWRADQT